PRCNQRLDPNGHFDYFGGLGERADDFDGLSLRNVAKIEPKWLFFGTPQKVVALKLRYFFSPCISHRFSLHFNTHLRASL
ncbi:MAG: hypothetical protein O6940_11400, partial [Ignavibacteria bacterium]|nr:hypothetical protein [Ignavibacteria bacterium]